MITDTPNPLVKWLGSWMAIRMVRYGLYDSGALG